MKIGRIYILLCPIDNIVKYVGQTSGNLNNRLQTHIRKTVNKIKYNKKLSKKEFWIKNLINLSKVKELKIEQIEECDINILNEREIYWIKYYKNITKLTNLTDGGDGTRGFHLTDEHKRKISINRKGKCLGKDHHCYGKKIGEEPWFKLSYISKYENPNIGRKRSDETKLKLSLAKRGDKNGMYGKRFNKTPEQILNLSKSLLNSDKLKKSRNSIEYKKKLSDLWSKPLLVLDMNFNIIMEFKNCRECAEYLNYKEANISNAINQLRKIGKGKKEKYWVVRKNNYEEYILKIKEKFNI